MARTLEKNPHLDTFETRREKVARAYTVDKRLGGNLRRAYYKKGVMFGDYLDLIVYNNVNYGFNQKRSDYSKSSGGTKRNDSVGRARINLYRLILGNVRQHGRFRPIFATYTFKERMPGIDDAYSSYKYYISKLNRYLGYKSKWVLVPEQQKNGNWHFHVVFFNLPKMDFKVNDKMWNQGHSAVNMQFITGRYDSIAKYLSKYLSKDWLLNRGKNKKLYSCSRGLKRPIEMFREDTIANILESANIKVLQIYEGNNYTHTRYKLS